MRRQEAAFTIRAARRRRAALFLPFIIIVGVFAVRGKAGAFGAVFGAAGPDRDARVTAVIDGDTIKVRFASGGEERRVRLIGVDTPEMDAPQEKVRFMAYLAKRYTDLKLFGRDVRLSFDRDKEDAYGRLLAYVRLENGAVFNEVLIFEGFGYGYFKYPFDEGFRRRFKSAEDAARAGGKGIWRKEPWPVIEPCQARASLGRIVAVTFKCAKSFKRGRWRVISPDGQDLEIVIPRDVLTSLPGDLDCVGRMVTASGLVEEYKGKPQIMIGVPSQLKFGS